jgi:hypothetical protein
MGCLHGVREKQPAVTTDGGSMALLTRLREARRDQVGEKRPDRVGDDGFR